MFTGVFINAVSAHEIGVTGTRQKGMVNDWDADSGEAMEEDGWEVYESNFQVSHRRRVLDSLCHLVNTAEIGMFIFQV